MAETKRERNTRKPWRDALKEALERYESGDIKAGRALYHMAINTVERALSGDLGALSEIANRIDGKAHQSIELTGDITHRDARELSDAELADIASSGSAGTTQTPGSAGKPSPVH